MPETKSAGAQEAGRACAGRDRSACPRWSAVESTGRRRTTEGRKAEDVPAPEAVEENGAAVGFMDGKPRGLTSGSAAGARLPAPQRR